MRLEERMANKKGWQRVIFLTIQGYFTNNIGRTAAAMTYYLLFAMFPFLIFVTSLLGLLDLPMLTLDGEITRFLPADVVAFLNLAIVHITKSSSNALLTFGLVFTIWFPYRAVSNLMEAVNDIYDGKHVDTHVNFFRILFVTILIIILIPVMILLMLLGTRMLEWLSTYFPISMDFIQDWATLRFLPMAAALLFVLSLVYFLSSSEKHRPRHILPGAVLSMLFWMGFSFLFSFYADHMGKYSLIYGSIGVVIALLVWMNCSMIAMLMGAVFNVALRQVYEPESKVE